MSEEQVNMLMQLVDCYAEAAVKVSQGAPGAFEVAQNYRNDIAAGLLDVRMRLTSGA